MPRGYKKRSRFRRYTGYASAAAKAPFSALGLAVKAVRGVKYLKGIINAEQKFKGSGTVTATIDDAGTVQPLFEMNQGDNNGERIGLQVKASWMEIRFVGKINATSQTDTQMRVIIFVDKQQVADSDTNVGNVLSGVSTYSPHNELDRGRFRYLYDRQFSLNSTNKGTFIVHKRIRLNLKIRYNGTAFTDIQKNGIYLLLLSGESSNLPTFVFNVGLHYYDN